MQVKVLQWNIWYREDPVLIAEQINHINPDIACIQEIGFGFHKQTDIPQLIATAMDHADFNYKQAQSWNDKSGFRTQGNAVFSKFLIQNSSFVELQPDIPNTDDFSKEGRNYVEVTVDLGHTSLTVGTTHLSYTHRFIETPKKDQQVALLEKLISKKSQRYVLTGDFNAPPESKYILQMLRHLRDVSPPYEAKTWTTKPFKEGEFEENDLNWRLDYIFASRDIDKARAEIIKTEYSDHLPILLTIEI